MRKNDFNDVFDLSQVSNVDSGTGCSVEASPSSPSAMSMESLVDENVANQTSSPNASDAVEEEVKPDFVTKRLIQLV